MYGLFLDVKFAAPTIGSLSYPLGLRQIGAHFSHDILQLSNPRASRLQCRQRNAAARTRRRRIAFLTWCSGSGFWQSIDLRICAIRYGRQWINLVTRGFLDHRATRTVPEFSPVDRPDLRASLRESVAQPPAALG